MKTGLATGALLSLAMVTVSSVSGCKTKPYCDSLGACGGDFLNGGADIYNNDGLLDREWTVLGEDTSGNPTGAVCQDQLQTPPAPLALLRQPPVQANQRPPDTITSDWCYNLVLKSTGDVDLFELWQPPLPIKVGQFTISEDFDHSHNRGTYIYQNTTDQTETLHLTESCLTAQGIRLQCPEFGRRLGEYLEMEPNLYYVRCYDPDDKSLGGCDCQYELSFIGGTVGRWYSDPGSTQITFFNQSFAFADKADYCYYPNDKSIDLTGSDDSALFNQTSLRTMHMTAPSCNDGVRSYTLGEEGIDCGGQCPNACGSCTNGKHDSNEDGIDCGGACLGVLCDPDPAVTDPNQRQAACADGKKEKWEEGVDCGGPCTYTSGPNMGQPILCP
jgi:hypothetical protein